MNKYLRQLLRPSLIVLVLSISLGAIASADSSSVSGAIVQSYSADSSVLSGMVVELKTKGQNEVVPLTYKDSRNMLGIVIPPNSAPLTLAPASANSIQQVLVATAGEYNVLVSNQGGPIAGGDYLTISSLAGIAMKASNDQQEVIGKAATSFSGSGSTLGTTSIKGGPGQPSTVTLGQALVDLRLAPNPLYHSSSSLPGVVTKTADSVANKPVSIVQIYLSLTLLFLTFFTTGTIYYGGVRSGIVSIGRNPLSKKSIVAGLMKVVVVGLIIFGAGAAAAYLVLKF